MLRIEKCQAMVVATALAALWGSPSRGQTTAGTNGDCVNNGQSGSPFAAGTGSVTVTPIGGQVSGAGATLFADFFTFAASTNDAVDVDNDGRRGFDGISADSLSTLWPINGTITTHWMFQYRSVGSVNGYNEFVGNQTCGAKSVDIAGELGIFNQFRYDNAGVLLWGGPYANSSGTPVEPCEIEFSFLDVPSKWGTRVDGPPKWSKAPLQPGYGLNPTISSTGFVSQLQTLTRECGTCVGGPRNGEPCTVGVRDVQQCPAPGACVTDGISKSLNANTSAADEDTIFDYVGAWTPVAYLANRGTGLQNVKYSEMQHAFLTGRMPNGENIAVGTRSVGSGTRNAIMTSTGMDTSWARGDNVGSEYAINAGSNLGVPTQTTNSEGSSQVENVVQQNRLSIGYTGLAGPSRAIADAIAGNYEILNVCKNVVARVCSGGGAICTTVKDCPGGETCDPIKRCSVSFQQCGVDADCLPSGGTCDVEVACACNPQVCANGVDGRNVATPNNGYVRPNFNTVLDNCDQCCGYQIGGNGSFVFRGNPDANRDPGMKCDGASEADCLVDGDCPNGESCTILKTYCMNSCVGGTSPGKVCGSNSDCPGGGSCAVGNENFECDVTADCTGGGGPGGSCEEKKRCVNPTTGGSYKFCRTLSDCLVGDTDCVNQIDLKWVPDAHLDNQAVANYINNIADSIDQFGGAVVRNCKYTPTVCVADAVCLAEVFPQTCVDYTGLPGGTGLQCSISGVACAAAGPDPINCPDLTGNDIPQFCTPGASPRRCSFDTGTVCTTDANCPDTLENICQPTNLSGEFNLPGQLLASTFFLPKSIDCTQSLDSGMLFTGATGLNQSLQDYARANFSPNTPAFGSVNSGTGGKAGIRNVLSPPEFYSDGQANLYVYWNGTDPGGVTGYKTLGAGAQLARRNMIQGDFDRDCTRTVSDAGELVAAYVAPRAWQKSLIAANPGGGCLGASNAGAQTNGGSLDAAIPEVIGDFDGDGSLTKEDLRYFADGLAMVTVTPSHCSVTVATPCVFDSQCPANEACVHDRRLDRKAGAIAIDTAIDARPCPNNSGVCSNNPATACTLDADCGGGNNCVCYPWMAPGYRQCSTGAMTYCRADQTCIDLGQGLCTKEITAESLLDMLQLPAASLGAEPTFLPPVYVNDPAGPFHKTGKPYANGDFRGDVAGGRAQKCVSGKCNITGFGKNPTGACTVDADCVMTAPVAGAAPLGWDGHVDEKDINYCCRYRGDWSSLNDAVFMDLSCDMDGDGTVDGGDIDELVEVILGTDQGDANLDGVVDDVDQAIVVANLVHPCNATSSCGWEQGDFDCDGKVDKSDLFLFPVSPEPVETLCIGGANAGMPCATHSECPGGFCHLRNRFLSILPDPAATTAVKPMCIRVELVDLPGFPSFNGQQRFAGAPALNINDGISPAFNAAPLVCTCTPQNWSALTNLHLYGSEVVPVSRYTVSLCNTDAGPCTAPLAYNTARFGDVVAPLNNVNFQDVNSIVAKFQGTPAGPSKTRTKLQGQVPNPANPINFQEVSACVAAFQGKTFQQQFPAGPQVCP